MQPRSYLVTSFPSPQPSPLGRGRTVCRLSAYRSILIAVRQSANQETLDCCSLSPRERVRVRGNVANKLSAGLVNLLRNRTRCLLGAVASPSPLPLLWGEGEPFAGLLQIGA